MQPHLQGRPHLQPSSATCTSAISRATMEGQGRGVARAVGLDPDRCCTSTRTSSAAASSSASSSPGRCCSTSSSSWRTRSSACSTPRRASTCSTCWPISRRAAWASSSSPTTCRWATTSATDGHPPRGRIVEMGATAKVFGNPLHPYTKMLLASVPSSTIGGGRRGRGGSRVGRRRGGTARRGVSLSRGPPGAARWTRHRTGAAPDAASGAALPALVEVETGHQVGCRRGEGEAPC